MNAVRILTLTAAVLVTAVAADSGAVKKTSDILGAVGFQPTPERPVGWRGDWTGRFLGATPPLTWNRRVKGATSDLKYQADKPAGESDKGAQQLEYFTIKDWLVAGPQATLYAGPGGRGADVRRRVIEPTLAAPPREAELGVKASNGAPWRFYAPGENFFVDCSAFYHQLTKVDLLASTGLRVPHAGTHLLMLHGWPAVHTLDAFIRSSSMMACCRSTAAA